MTCEFNDGLKVSYCGPLRIKKDGEINLFLDRDEVWEELPHNISGELLEAASTGNCSRMEYVAKEVINSFGTNLPE